MKNKNNYCDCFFKDNFIFIKLNKSLNIYKKILVEVCTLGEEFICKLNYLLIYNKQKDYNQHFKKILDMDVQKFFKGFNFDSQNVNILENEIKSEIIGYIILYSKNYEINNSNLNKFDNISISTQDSYIPIKQKFNAPPGIGLQNVGATCYMNATIQCLCQIEKLVDYFKSNPRINKIIEEYKIKNEDCLTISFRYLIENLWPTNKKYFNKKYNFENTNNKYFVPTKFKEKISKMNPLFEGAKANDSKDLVNFIIMRLHDELNEGIKCQNDIAPSQEEELSMLKFFQQSYFQENKSIISDLFYGINGTIYECSSCHNRKYNY